MARSTAGSPVDRPGSVVAAPPVGRVLIVDDHPFFTDGLAAILRQESLVLQVGRADSVAAGIRYLKAHPDTGLVLLDLGLPGEGGMVFFSELDALGLAVPVVVISSTEDERVIRGAHQTGAMGYMSKAAGRATLVRMVRQVSRGERFFPELALAEPTSCYLTPRQQEVLQLLAEGLPNKRICQHLDLTDHTVKTHLKAIFSQLGVHSRTECVARARLLGLI
ncbi:MAG: response regulator transcription factor [Marinobacter sp.]|uniref:response regulator transcription factor n=1 Tax=Marinobacter sp. TaxID=50741 RepID=UPI00299D3D97|nr:response regulator transcription factor [Marinobacter sp.]MDX1633584.1 response regulator transcription factor [Marinobacter sp.]